MRGLGDGLRDGEKIALNRFPENSKTLHISTSTVQIYMLAHNKINMRNNIKLGSDA